MTRTRWLPPLLLIAAGALQTLTFSPFHWWWLGPPAILLILLASLQADPRNLFRAGWLMGIGLFGSGASWVYISISVYGNTSAPIALLLTAAFVAGLAVFPALTFWAWGKLAGPHPVRRLILFPALWILGDWVRGWLLTGFPWLYLGTAHVDGPLAGYAPVFGVFALTFLVVASGVALYGLIWLLSRQRRVAAAVLAAPLLLAWLAGPLLAKVNWTERQPEPITVAAMQGNIPQQIKWDPEFLIEQIHIYLGLSAEDWNRDLLLWPETAIPLPQDRAAPIFERILDELGPDSTLITGIPWHGFSERLEDFTYHNSIMALGQGDGFYHKRKLVPFGEYVPMEQWLRGLIGFFDLPMSSFTRGPAQQSPLRVRDKRVMPFVCYEIAYPDFVATNARHTDLLITISNDGWFGHSLGPLQHQQIARMRALETGRFLLRGTNNGITAIIDDRGQVTDTIPQFTRGTLRGEVYLVKGNTPYMQAGSWPILTLAAILIVFVRERELRKDNI